jgi:hypothetical protein
MLGFAVLVYLLPAYWLAWPPGRRFLAIPLAGLAVALLVYAVLLAGATAELEVTHAVQRYAGGGVEQQAFPVDRTRAPAWIWPAGTALVLLGLAFVSRRSDPGHSDPFREALLAAWAGLLVQAGWQYAAAPAALALGPAHPPLQAAESVLFPLTAVAAVRLGWVEPRFRGALLRLFLIVSLTRLPLALAGTWLTRERLGTWLDVHPITFFVTLGERPIDTTPGSSDQLAWLIWVPQLVLMPLITLLGTGGLAFAAAMFRKGRMVGRA